VDRAVHAGFVVEFQTLVGAWLEVECAERGCRAQIEREWQLSTLKKAGDLLELVLRWNWRSIWCVDRVH
jgi:hypothetical protein